MIGEELRARIDTVKRQVRIEDQIRRRGVELWACASNSSRLEGHCPFHDDSHPSLSIYAETQRYHCFGCGASGDVLDFIQAYDGCSLSEALDRLQSLQSAPAVPEQPRSRKVSRYFAQLPSQPSLPYHPVQEHDHFPALTQAQTIYQQQLWQMPHALQYLETRGVTRYGIEQSCLGYADGTALRLALKGKTRAWQAAAQAGLLSRHGQEWFTGRLVIPDVDERGNVIWIIGRILPAGPEPQRAIRPSEKYLGLSLPKSLLGYHRALARWQSEPDGWQAILLLEGALDYVLARQWMLPVLPVALLGTYPSRSQWAHLLHLQQVTGLPVIDWHDADEPGRQAALQVHERAPGPLIPFPEIAGVNDLADLGLRSDGLVRLQHAWHAISDSREE